MEALPCPGGTSVCIVELADLSNKEKGTDVVFSTGADAVTKTGCVPDDVELFELEDDDVVKDIEDDEDDSEEDEDDDEEEEQDDDEDIAELEAEVEDESEE